MISYFVGVAVINGIIIGLSRALNGRLGMSAGVLKASLWNHIVGFSFLTLLLIITASGFSWKLAPAIPMGAYMGGVIGAIFVAVNSYVFPTLGAARTILMVTSGQLILGVCLDYRPGHEFFTMMQFIGIVIISIGVSLDKKLEIQKKNITSNRGAVSGRRKTKIN